MKETINDEVLIRAARLVGESMRASLSALDSYECTLSPEFENQMKRLAEKTKLRQLFRRVVRRMAILILTAFFGFSIWLIADANIRAVFFA